MTQPDPDFEHVARPSASDIEDHDDYAHDDNLHHDTEYDGNLGTKGEFLDTWVSNDLTAATFH